MKYSRELQITMLAKYGLTLPESVLKQLEELPLAWKSLKKKMFQR